MSTPGHAITVRCQFCQTWNRVDGARAADRPKCGNCSRFILLDRPFALFEDSFQRTIDETELPVLVDFYADWCGPCKKLAPLLDQLAYQTPDARIVKVNIDDSPELAIRYGVKGIPHLKVFKDGKAVAQHVGLANQQQLTALLSL